MVGPSKKCAPWFGPELKRLLDERNAARRRFKRTRHAEHRDEYLRLNNEVDVHIIQERDTYIHKHLSDAIDNNKNVWKEMRNLGLFTKV